jgi:hypothetical protein
MKRIATGSSIVIALVLSAGSAGTATPQGSCPPNFPAPNPIQISSIQDPDLQAFATCLDTEVGGNGDGRICITTIASGTPGEGTSVLDNRVAGF